MLDGPAFEAWFRLLETPGIGRERARRLLAACGSAEAVISATASTLRQLVGTEAATALAAPPPLVAQRLQTARAWLEGAPDRHWLTIEDAAYPPQLLQSPDPPLLLYVIGRMAILAAHSLAVVGSRRPTPQGEDNARAFALDLGQHGLTVVSGLAQGIDRAAHEGAIDTVAGTIAVVGTGLDRVFPAAHRKLAHRIAEHGALVSEYPPGTPPLPEHFPQRNRIIAGLAQGTLVVEAALRSGSLITARLASEAGREVFAIPGSIHSPQSKGCHALLKQGAKLVESAQDILEELRPALPAAAPSAATLAAAEPTSADPLLAALGDDPVTLDALMARTGFSAAALTARLLTLELDGMAARLPGGLYQRRHNA